MHLLRGPSGHNQKTWFFHFDKLFYIISLGHEPVETELTECYMKLEATTIARIGREVLFKETFELVLKPSLFVHEISSRY